MAAGETNIEAWFKALRPYVVLLDIKTQYSIGKQLGRGNFASVFEATSLETGASVAIKSIDKSTILESKRNLVTH